MNILQVFLPFLIFLANSRICQGNNPLTPFYIKTHSVGCCANSEMVANYTCKLKPINWEKSVAVFEADLLRIIRNATLRVELLKYTNQFRPFLVNITFNACDMIKTGSGSPYARVFINLLARYSTVNHSCPYWGHQEANGAYFDSQLIPFIVPTGKYKLILTFYEGWPWEYIATVEGIGSIMERKGMPKIKPRKGIQRTLLAENLHN